MRKTFSSLIYLLFVSISLISCRQEKEINVFHDLQDVNNLVLAEMSLNKVGVISDDGAKGIDAFINSFKIGDRVAAYSYQTYIEASIDLSELREEDITVDNERRLVKITLPKIQTRYIGRDLGVKEEHYRVTRARSEITAKERAELKEKMSRSLKEDIRNNEGYHDLLVTEAKKKARGFLTIMLRDRGYDCEISFRD